MTSESEPGLEKAYNPGAVEQELYRYWSCRYSAVDASSQLMTCSAPCELW